MQWPNMRAWASQAKGQLRYRPFQLPLKTAGGCQHHSRPQHRPSASPSHEEDGEAKQGTGFPGPTILQWPHPRPRVHCFPRDPVGLLLERWLSNWQNLQLNSSPHPTLSSVLPPSPRNRTGQRPAASSLVFYVSCCQFTDQKIHQCPVPF